jgi:hypothetical protein
MKHLPRDSAYCKLESLVAGAAIVPPGQSV